jgi:hypothetical protein
VKHNLAVNPETKQKIFSALSGIVSRIENGIISDSDTAFNNFATFF